MSGTRRVWLAAVAVLTLALVVVFLVLRASPLSPGPSFGSLDPKSLPGPGTRLSGIIVGERSESRQPWSVILSVHAGGRDVDVVTNQYARYVYFSAPLEGLSSTGSQTEQPASLQPMPSRQDMIEHAVGLRFVGWVRTAHVGPFGVRPALVMYDGSFASP